MELHSHASLPEVDSSEMEFSSVGASRRSYWVEAEGFKGEQRWEIIKVIT